MNSETRDNIEIYVISCFFGYAYNTLFKAPREKDHSFFFTNNSTLFPVIEGAGWTPVLLNMMTLTHDVLESSLQAKCVKFLQFMKLLPTSVMRVLYVDHKFELQSTHLDHFKQLIEKHPDKSIFIRKTPSLKTNIWDEVEACRPQPRYQAHLPQTITWIQEMLKRHSNLYHEQVRISNTGLILYCLDRHPQKIQHLVDTVYGDVIQLKQPECQLFWAIRAQPYTDIIHQMEWEDVCIHWGQYVM